MKLTLFPVVLACALSSLARASAGRCAWYQDPTDRYQNVFWPDTNANYWRFSYEVTANDSYALKVSGTFPHARYMSLQVYDQRSWQNVGARNDAGLIPDAGSPGTYTLWIVPARKRETVERIGAQNVIEMPEVTAQPRDFELWYRIYLPDAGYDTLGGAAAPRIEARDPDTLGPVADCPKRVSLPFFPAAVARHLPPKPSGNQIRFSALDALHIQPNDDVRYGVALLSFPKGRPLAVVSFKAPGHADMRYWSLCLVGAMSGITTSCLADSQVEPDPGSAEVRVAVGPEWLEAEARSRGFHFIPRGHLFLPVLALRDLGIADQARSLTGEYLPQGRYYGTDEFLSAFPRRAAAPAPATPVPVPDAPEVRPPHELRIGVAVTAFLGQLWAEALQHGDLSGLQNELPVRGLQKELSEKLQERAGLSAKVELGSPDVLADRLNEGRLDFVYLPGEDFVWISRNHPNLEPLVFGSLLEKDKPFMKTLLLVRRERMAEKGNLHALKGLILAAAPFRSHSLPFLYRALLDAGEEPDGFFRKPETVWDNFEDPVDDVVDGKADVAILDDAGFAAYSRRKPGRLKRLGVFLESPQLPPPVVVYNPLTISEEIENFMEDFFLSFSRRPEDAYSDMLRTLIGRAVGVDQIGLVTPDLARVLDRHAESLREYSEYFLPVYFFNREAVGRKQP